jgi:hypothetical protein
VNGTPNYENTFQHPHPPIEWLEATRQFAKTCRTNPEGPIPDEIATLLYALSIAVALTKCQRRITKLNDTGLRHCLGWAIAQTWVDADTRAVLYEGYRCLGSRESGNDA